MIGTRIDATNNEVIQRIDQMRNDLMYSWNDMGKKLVAAEVLQAKVDEVPTVHDRIVQEQTKAVQQLAEVIKVLQMSVEDLSVAIGHLGEDINQDVTHPMAGPGKDQGPSKVCAYVGHMIDLRDLGIALANAHNISLNTATGHITRNTDIAKNMDRALAGFEQSLRARASLASRRVR